MPTLADLLSYLQFISPETTLLGLFITATIILVSRDWRWLILALLAQYILVGVMLSRLVRPDIALLKVMIGAFICPILFLSARQVMRRGLSIRVSLSPDRGKGWLGRRLVIAVQDESARGLPETGFIFRLLAAGMMMLIASTLSETVQLPGLPEAVNTGVFWLILSGLITLTLTEDPMKVGLGLFTVLSGFEIFYTVVENSLLLIGLWGAINLLTALVVGYLVIIRGASLEEVG